MWKSKYNLHVTEEEWITSEVDFNVNPHALILKVSLKIIEGERMMQ